MISVPSTPPSTPRFRNVMRTSNRVTLRVTPPGARRRSAPSALPSITVRRKSAIGDVVMASGVVRVLGEHGYPVTLACEPACAEALQHSSIVTTNGYSDNDLNLDDSYEKHLDKKSTHKAHIFAQSVNDWLVQRKMDVPMFCNLAPRLAVTMEEREEAMVLLSRYARPWIAVSPRSNFWPQRTVPQAIWQKAAREAGFGSWLWTGTDPAPEPCIDLRIRSIRKLMAVIADCDMMVCVDSGPMHLAAGLGIPLVAVEQAASPELDLSDQRDHTVIGTGLACLNCNLQKCPIDELNPPCGNLSPALIISAVQSKLQSRRSGVSAVIPVWGQPKDRLRRCVEQVLPQVDELVIAFDGAETPNGIPIHPRIKLVSHRSRTRRGYGKTCNYGARQSSGQFILFLNDDVYLNPGAVAAMRRLAISDDKIGVVGMRLWYPNGTIQHGGTHRAPGDIGWGHTDHLLSNPTIQSACELENVTHAAALVRREAFYGVRCYDERYDCYSEDNDLNLELRKAGWKVFYEPNAEGIHEESMSSKPMKRELSLHSGNQFRKKWGAYFERNRGNNMGTF